MLFITAKQNASFYIKTVEDMGISYLANKRVENVKLSAVSDDLATCDCDINF